MILRFVGNAGGRYELIYNDGVNTATGGFRICGTYNIHVDPGPNVLCQMQKYGWKIRNTDIVITSHYHIDHVNDVNLFAEARKGITLICPLSMLDYKNTPITEYHRKRINIVIGKVNETWKNRGISITFTKTKHTEDGFGFILNMDDKTIGYTSDTAYFSELKEIYKHVDVLIINTMALNHNYKHLNVYEGGEIGKGIKKVIFYHISKHIIKNWKSISEKLKNKYNVEPILAMPGLELKI